MSREPDKRTGGRYFDLDVLCGVSADGEAFRSFLGRYASYVFKRARDFNARFQVSMSRLVILPVLGCLVELCVRTVSCITCSYYVLFRDVDYITEDIFEMGLNLITSINTPGG